MLQVKFSTGLEGMLPLDLTGRTAFEHIEAKVIPTIVATKAYLDLVQ